MLFSRERSIIFINREKIRWAKMQVPSGKLLGVIQEAVCSEENLRLALADIAKNYSNKARIVVGEEFSYVTLFQKGDEQKTTLGEAQALIPENLESGWDSKDGGGRNVQVMAVQQQVFAVIKKALLENKIEAEAMEAESISLSRMIPSEKDRVALFARFDEKILLEVVQNGIVLATRIFFQLPTKEKIQEFLDYVSSRNNITFETAYVQDESGELVKVFQALGINIQESLLDPMVGICQKKDIAGSDKEVLNIILEKEAKKAEINVKKSLAIPSTLREKILLVSFLIIFLGGMAVSYYIYQARQKTGKISPQSQGVSKY